MNVEPLPKYMKFQSFEMYRLRVLQDLNPESGLLEQELEFLLEGKPHPHTALLYLVRCKAGGVTEKEFIKGLWWHGEKHPDNQDDDLLRWSINEFGHELYFSRDERELLPVGTPVPVNVTVYG
ncbi:TPA: hypothetical protein ACMDXH_000735 [Vibrio parahaemolyticus]|nr:hypothetical protein [Vibrio parahaemolyticus]EHY8553039.1 hypothetical protein [Vibrio parahaemolyticus]EIA9327218.1 hypothetical protein [Vibrio parahaemolyticus]EJV9414062.1 hypothetical protein [Vibrio vulnificus]